MNINGYQYIFDLKSNTKFPKQAHSLISICTDDLMSGGKIMNRRRKLKVHVQLRQKKMKVQCSIALGHVLLTPLAPVKRGEREQLGA